jgi:GNAT superfamily N-acetyltransferase
VVEVVSCRDEADEQLSLDVYNAVWPHDRLTIEDVQSFKSSTIDHVDVLARINGAVAGSAVAAIEAERPGNVFAILTVLPKLRRRGAGTALYRSISAWTRDHGLDAIEVAVLDDDPESLGFATRRGFVENGREKGVVLRLAEIEPPVVSPPPGVEIVAWAGRPELARGMYEVWLEAIPDIPGAEDEQAEPFDDWLAHQMQGPGDKPEATFAAVAGDEVVGYAKFSLTAAQPTSAHHDLTGVKRAWRARGVARALKATQIAWAKANGYEELRTRNEERNAPIRKLNEEFGYRPAVGRIYLKGPLA